ncbi:hypothetical protein B2G71_09825 [Novosphingobium sp. PC22D]|uniref:formylglycine-generating enzyme family protein n=1 Tax=Novosphingobium sp. PC22D TaxID=1962403 RepID=UPI000BF0C7B8|nr:SUMF1/EgtB/PvdO family nonheme iron enzyme [Novosphingobium sp. PC22D]PEQ12604.1 hypothetical protein B2G71_09825 [Novosphingobium sp. PC22D]
MRSFKFLVPAAVGATLIASGTSHAADAAPTPGTTFVDGEGLPEMVVIAPGEFDMGADGGEPGRYEGPVHHVTIDYSFAVGVTPVTYAQFAKFVDDTGYEAATGCWVPREGTYVEIEGSNWQNPAIGREPEPGEPVVCIDWNDAKAYVDWLASTTGEPYRLLSEAEWEYVARAGTMTRFTWGDDPEGACENANLLDASGPKAMIVTGEPTECSDGYPGLAPAGSFAPNAFGVRDMVGNVWTWVEDCYAMPYPEDGPTNGKPQLEKGCDRRGARGSSWGTTYSRAHPTFRGRDPVTLVSQLFGVRVARDLK